LLVGGVSLFPLDLTHRVPVHSDKVVHFFIYTLLGLLAARTWAAQGRARCYGKGFLYASFVGISIECIQHFLPWRSFDILDIVCNVFGSGLGVALARLRIFVRQA